MSQLSISDQVSLQTLKQGENIVASTVEYWSCGYSMMGNLRAFPILKRQINTEKEGVYFRKENILEAAKNRSVVLYIVDDELNNLRSFDKSLAKDFWFIKNRTVQASSINYINQAIRYINNYHVVISECKSNA